ncbi:MAG: coproporphyrinogen III oxidase, partial [Candidatus Omnitrophica bacterium]|nr:coproporphyrinogen III oxidase [Candidatus Omnitrophota bacterium]
NDEKLEIFLVARDLFLNNGYEAIAMDHFALKEDEMAQAFRQGTLHRNFMGYTVKPADEYIGIGTSAIGFLEGAYFQNYKTIPEYYGILDKGDLPIERGMVLSEDDHIRGWVINKLMCKFSIDKDDFKKTFGRNFDEYFKEEKDHLRWCVEEKLCEILPNRIETTELGKIFIRNICMGFDWYLRQQDAHRKFSRTV